MEADEWSKERPTNMYEVISVLLYSLYIPIWATSSAMRGTVNIVKFHNFVLIV